ncbi:hypothetical protein HYFRA_00010838 [Hymenoscyphus fraxineus]|uniref:Glutathione S-transferase n=1 Tax=Hymenoscyphus fraxineus TaxID=746836 RepID=A0A9N9KYM5_9HELO|nr:hypothetical protein HYFRA_00010838 [Hymenoscyphus fraxineus]
MATTAATADAEQQAVLKPGLPTLHHLNHSQSQRILWLLEELDVEYNHVAYTRVQGRAPPELAKIHPLGKSPTFVNKDGRVIIESSVIISYIIDTYDTSHKFAVADQIRSDEISAFASATLAPITSTEILFELIHKNTPWPFSYLTGALRSKIQNLFSMGEMRKGLRYLQSELGDEEWFNGGHPGKSDFLVTFPVDLIAERRWIDLGKEFPRLAAWRGRVRERPAWKRGLEKGNGYELDKL